MSFDRPRPHAEVRDRITSAMCDALEPLAHVLAGWESGSVAW